MRVRAVDLLGCFGAFSQCATCKRRSNPSFIVSSAITACA
jgi:hypothetical protein